MFTRLLDKLELLSKYRTSVSESLNSLEFEGKDLNPATISCITDVDMVLVSMGSQTSLSIFVDEEKILREELASYEGTRANWRIHINKQRVVSEEECVCLFFYDIDSFKRWADSTNPFSKDNLFNSNKCCIQVYKLGCSIIADNFIIGETLDSMPIGGNDTLDNKVKLHLRNYDSTKIVKPSKHIIVQADKNGISDIFYMQAIRVMLLSLCDEIHENSIVLNGVRRIDLLINDNFIIHQDIAEAHDLLREIMEWIYLIDERSELRHKLLIDRMTLDISLKHDFYSGALLVLKYAFAQAKERYAYAIYDRANQYHKELKELLKDMKSLGELYSSTLRSIIRSFSRDFLAALLTIGITLFSRYNDLNNLSSLGLLKYVFTAFGVYVIISIFVQCFCDICDLFASEKEFDYWKKVTREYMSEDDFNSHKLNTFQKRKNKFRLQYFIILMLYVGLAIFSFKAPMLWQNLTDKSPVKEQSVNKIHINDTIPRNTDTTVCCPQDRK